MYSACSTYLISLDFDTFLLDIHSKHLFDIPISDCFVPNSDGEPSYTPNIKMVSTRTR